MKIIVGTTNQAKLKAVETVCLPYFDAVHIQAISGQSGISAQPIGNEETRLGAVNRALEAISHGEGTIGLGLEGGVMYVGDTMYLCNWGAMALPNGRVLTAAGAQIPLPDRLKKEIEQGEELGPLMEAYVNQQGIRQKEGAMGILTDGLISRSKLFEHVMELLVGQYFYLEKHPHFTV